ncbi:MAG: hypothetical protein ABJL72_07075 [Roseobacter sp.]
MQTKPQDLATRIRQVVDRLSTENDTWSVQGRLIATVSDSVLPAILREIEETVLPRRLVFCSLEDTQMVLDVAERRVLSVVNPAITAGCLGGVIREGEQDADAVFEAISIFSASATRVFVSSCFIDPGTGAECGGISVEDIFARFHTAGTGSGLSDALIEALQDSKSRDCHFLVTREGVVIQRSQEKSANDRLQHLSMMKKSKNRTGNDVTLWFDECPQDYAVLQICIDEWVVFVQCPSANVFQCFKVWKSVALE